MCKELQASIGTVTKQNSDLKKELKFKQKCLQTYEHLLKAPATNDDHLQCKQCKKVFVSSPYLQKHYLNKHSAD